MKNESVRCQRLEVHHGALEMSKKNSEITQMTAEKVVEIFAGQTLFLAQARGCGLQVSASQHLKDEIGKVNHPEAVQIAANIQISESK